MCLAMKNVSFLCISAATYGNNKQVTSEVTLGTYLLSIESMSASQEEILYSHDMLETGPSFSLKKKKRKKKKKNTLINTST